MSTVYDAVKQVVDQQRIHLASEATTYLVQWFQDQGVTVLQDQVGLAWDPPKDTESDAVWLAVSQWRGPGTHLAVKLRRVTPNLWAISVLGYANLPYHIETLAGLVAQEESYRTYLQQQMAQAEQERQAYQDALRRFRPWWWRLLHG